MFRAKFNGTFAGGRLNGFLRRPRLRLTARFRLGPRDEVRLRGDLPLQDVGFGAGVQRVLIVRSYEGRFGSRLPARLREGTQMKVDGREGICAHRADAVPRGLRRPLRRAAAEGVARAGARCRAVDRARLIRMRLAARRNSLSDFEFGGHSPRGPRSLTMRLVSAMTIMTRRCVKDRGVVVLLAGHDDVVGGVVRTTRTKHETIHAHSYMVSFGFYAFPYEHARAF